MIDTVIPLSAVYCPKLHPGDLCIIGTKKIYAVYITTAISHGRSYYKFITGNSGILFTLHKEYYNDCYLIKSIRTNEQLENSVYEQILETFSDI